MKRLCCFLLFAALLMAAPAWAQDWGAVANVSATMGVNGNRLCYGEASRGDIGCPADAPTVSGSTIQGTFVGDGSGLTGVTAASADRIVSGTAKVIANGNSNSISITESGVTTGYYYGGNWVAGGVSTTGMISSTNLFVSGSAGIGRAGISSSALTLGGSLRMYQNPTAGGNGTLLYDINGFIGTDAATGIHSGNGKYYADTFSTGAYYGVSYYGHTIATGPFPNGNSVGLSYNQASFGPTINGYHQKLLNFTGTVTGSGLVTATGLYTAIGDSTSNSNTIVGLYADVTSGTNINASRYAALLIGGNVGIGTISPKATLEVSGTVSATNFVGNGSGLTGISMATDRITSGTTSVIANQSSGIVSLTGVLDISTSINSTAINLPGGYKISTKNGGGPFIQGIPYVMVGHVNGTVGATFSTLYAGQPQLLLVPMTGQDGLIVRNGGGATTDYALRVASTGEVMVGTVSGSTPSATLTVSGTAAATTLQLADSPATVCGPATYGTTKFIHGRPYYCRP